MTSPPVLAFVNSTCQTTLNADGCTVQVGCLLLQHQEDGRSKPIGYWSRSQTDAERQYDTTQPECLPIVLDVLVFRPYLERATFTIRTNHNSPMRIPNLMENRGVLPRWGLRLADFEFDIVHEAVINNQAAATHSRLRTSGEDNTTCKDGLPLLAIDTMHNLSDAVICVIDTTEGDFLPVKNDNTKVSLNTQTIENEFLINQRKKRTAKLQLYKYVAKYSSPSSTTAEFLFASPMITKQRKLSSRNQWEE